MSIPQNRDTRLPTIRSKKSKTTGFIHTLSSDFVMNRKSLRYALLFLPFLLLIAGVGLGSLEAAQSETPTYETVVPLFMSGSFDGGNTEYRTTIRLVNNGDRNVISSVNFYSPDGSRSDVHVATGDSPFASGFSSSGLAPAAELSLATDTSGTTGEFAWALVRSDGHLRVEAVLELFDAESGTVISRVDVPCSPPDLQRFVIPFINDPTTGLASGFGIVNTANQPVSITATAIGLGALSTATIDLDAMNQTTLMVRDLFGAELLEAPPGGVFPYVVIESTEPTLGVAALVLDGSQMISFPVGNSSGTVGPQGPAGLPGPWDGLCGGIRGFRQP